MDLEEYCINLSKPANDLFIRGRIAIKNLSVAGIISTNNAGNKPAFPF